MEDDMKAIGAAVMAALVIAVATPAGAQVPGADVVRGSELTTSSVPVGADAGGGQTAPLFTLGRDGVQVWTPVAPPYNPQANGDLAARDIWGAG
jgi:hypothetical protein